MGFPLSDAGISTKSCVLCWPGVQVHKFTYCNLNLFLRRLLINFKINNQFTKHYNFIYFVLTEGGKNAINIFFHSRQEEFAIQIIFG